jgi:hypothetical protein
MLITIFYRAFEWALSFNGKVNLADGLENPDLPGLYISLITPWPKYQAKNTSM